MKVSRALKVVSALPSNGDQKLGSYYVRKLRHGWSLYHQQYKDGEKTSVQVEKMAYPELGFRLDMSLEEARARCVRLNKENNLSKQTIREAAARAVGLQTIDKVFFPPEYVSKFEALLKDENQGSEEHLSKLFSHFEYIQKMIVKLAVLPGDYKSNDKRIYKYLIKDRVSVNYSQRLISLLNRYAKFVAEQEGRFFREVSQARGITRQQLSEAHEGKTGIRKASEPLTPRLLEDKKEELSERNYNWLYVSLWFGLRPSEFKTLEKYKVHENEDKVQFLGVYQSKLTSISKEKRFKYIPVLEPEQKKALRIIESQNMKAPIYKRMNDVFGEGYGLYAGRKGFVDLMLIRGYKIEDISIWLGHQKLETTWTHYKEKNALKLPTPKKRN